MKQPKMRKGAVMMEYVILAVMIAAAALVAIIYFGKTITTQAQSASQATAGNSKEAQNTSSGLMKKQTEWVEKGSEHNDAFSDVKTAKDGKGGEGGGGNE